jgi:hypothetical protein
VKAGQPKRTHKAYYVKAKAKDGLSGLCALCAASRPVNGGTRRHSAPILGKQWERLYILILKGEAMPDVVPQEIIENRIFIIRGKKVMIDLDLAALYGAPTKALNQAVKRNVNRFPEDFMFQLDKTEKNQLVTNCDRFTKLKHSVSCPYAFTENGVAMLSSVLNSETAVMVNIQIMRAFTRLRNLVADNSGVRKAIADIEKRLNIHDRQIQIAFDALKSLFQPKPLLPHKHYSPEDEKKMGFGKGKK